MSNIYLRILLLAVFLSYSPNSLGNETKAKDASFTKFYNGSLYLGSDIPARLPNRTYFLTSKREFNPTKNEIVIETMMEGLGSGPIETRQILSSGGKAGRYQDKANGASGGFVEIIGPLPDKASDLVLTYRMPLEGDRFLVVKEERTNYRAIRGVGHIENKEGSVETKLRYTLNQINEEGRNIFNRQISLNATEHVKIFARDNFKLLSKHTPQSTFSCLFRAKDATQTEAYELAKVNYVGGSNVVSLMSVREGNKAEELAFYRVGGSNKFRLAPNAKYSSGIFEFDTNNASISGIKFQWKLVLTGVNASDSRNEVLETNRDTCTRRRTPANASAAVVDTGFWIRKNASNLAVSLIGGIGGPWDSARQKAALPGARSYICVGSLTEKGVDAKNAVSRPAVNWLIEVPSEKALYFFRTTPDGLRLFSLTEVGNSRFFLNPIGGNTFIRSIKLLPSNNPAELTASLMPDPGPAGAILRSFFIHRGTRCAAQSTILSADETELKEWAMESNAVDINALKSAMKKMMADIYARKII